MHYHILNYSKRFPVRFICSNIARPDITKIRADRPKASWRDRAIFVEILVQAVT